MVVVLAEDFSMATEMEGVVKDNDEEDGGNVNVGWKANKGEVEKMASSGDSGIGSVRE